MTPTERRAALQAIGWSQRGLADRLQWDEGTVRRWMRDGGEAPPDIDRWLATLAQFHDEHPPPARVQRGAEELLHR
jgi:transcriptional regulator with XRE-family HTH domain